MARCTFREILASYRNQITARLAASAGFCLSVHIRTASAVLGEPEIKRRPPAVTVKQPPGWGWGLPSKLLPLHPENILSGSSWEV